MKKLRLGSAKLSRINGIVIISVFVAVLSAGLMSCSSDEDPTPEPFRTRTSTPLPTDALVPIRNTPAQTRIDPTDTPTPVPPTATLKPQPSVTHTPLLPTPTRVHTIPTITPLPPTPTSIPTPIPPTPTPEPTATATPIPATYSIESLDWDIRGPEGDKIAVRFNMQVLNEGEMERDSDTSVKVIINDAAALEVTKVPPLGGGEETTLHFDLRLEPGQQQLKLQVDKSVSHAALDLLASDIVISPVSYQIVSDGHVAISVRLTNIGRLASRPVQLISSNKVVATVQPIEPDSSEDVTFVLELQTGEHEIEVVVSADESEARLSNNTTILNIQVEYVALSLQAGKAEVLGFIRGGTANVSIEFTVDNIGVADTGPFLVAVECPEIPNATCVGESMVDSLLPGGSFTGTINAVVPQGISDIVLFAGEFEYGYRWGDTNTIPITIEVPLQPDVQPVLATEATLNGYFSNGEGAVTVTASIRNDGAEPIPGEYPIAVTCLEDGNIVATCGGVLNLDLTDGYGPVEGSLELRAPAGEIDFQFESGDIVDVGESLSAVVHLQIPARIVGIDRTLWRCFALTRPTEEFPRGSCSGREGDIVSKWPEEEPITIWINGLSTYSEQFQDILQELAPQLNVTYQLVPEERGAAIAAYVGITNEDARNLGFSNCDGFWGCTSYNTNEESEIKSADIVIFEVNDAGVRQLALTNETIQSAMVKSLLHILVPLGYRNVPNSILSIDTGLHFTEMSESDSEIVRILTSPLVKAGDTTEDIEQLIVFNDDLLDQTEPEPPTALEIIDQARLKLHDERSALYSMRGNWSGGTCIDRFDPSQVTVSGFRSHRALYYRLTNATERFYVFFRSEDGRAEYWDGRTRAWRRFSVTDEQDLAEETSWSPQYSDPMVLLVSILWFGQDLLTEVSRDEDEIEYRVERMRGYATPEWTDEAVVSATLKINPSTYELESFSMNWHFDVRGVICDEYTVEANLIEYGVSLHIPSEIRNQSRVVD